MENLKMIVFFAGFVLLSCAGAVMPGHFWLGVGLAAFAVMLILGTLKSSNEE
ncbi:hypothetical protein [Actinoplanes awajinensis]|uniref:hypothetical protein n=1 Tax=Actinoplanes awajinensis TaxID=135946 RepID=UPI0012FB974C|nr:hypothetical protein [Actinoplanes awajinensis]